MPLTEKQVRENDRARQLVVDILHREIRLVARPDPDEDEAEWTWMVKPGNLEHCAKLIVKQLYS